MDEGLANYYYNKLQEGENAIPILTKMFFIITENKIKQKSSIYGMIGKLNNIYGTKIVFLSLLEMLTIEDISKYSSLGLLRNICKRKFDEKINSYYFNKDITSLADENFKDLKIKRNLVIPEIGELNDN